MGASTSYGRYAKEHLTNETKPDPWTDLANFIVAQAADEYRLLCRKAVKHGETMSDYEMSIVNGNLRDLEAFFRSDWGLMLSHGLAPVIWEKLKAEFDTDMKSMRIRREQRLANRRGKQ